MKRLSVVFMALLALVLSACSGGFNSPTSPTTASVVAPVQLTSVSTTAWSSSVIVQGMVLNWELGAGCVFQKPSFPASLVGSQPGTTRVLSSGNEVWGLWDDLDFPELESTCKDLGSDGTYSYSEVTTVKRYLMASFVKQSDEWRYCQWHEVEAVINALHLGTCADIKKASSTVLSEKAQILRVIE